MFLCLFATFNKICERKIQMRRDENEQLKKQNIKDNTTKFRRRIKLFKKPDEIRYNVCVKHVCKKNQI